MRLGRNIYVVYNKNHFKMSKKVNRIDELISEQETISNDALKNALARQIEEEKKVQEEKLLDQFRHAKTLLNHSVMELRRIRELEKNQVKQVKKIDTALKKFKEDGDFQAFKSVLGVYYSH